MKSIWKAMEPVALAGTLLSAAPASASSDWCWFDSAVFITSCTTAEVHADRGFIYFRVHNPYTHYQLKDTNMGVMIRDGITGGGWHYETVFGLTNWYNLRCSGPGGSCDLSNT